MAFEAFCHVKDHSNAVEIHFLLLVTPNKVDVIHTQLTSPDVTHCDFFDAQI
jgi:hypothetical protein